MKGHLETGNSKEKGKSHTLIKTLTKVSLKKE
jgi:hypothetical protein